MIGLILPPPPAAIAAAATALAPRARRCSALAATMATAAVSGSVSLASPLAVAALTGALERSTTATGSAILLSNDKDKWPQAASALTTLSLTAAHCFISMTQCRRGLDLTELPPLVTLMRFRETCGLSPVIVLGDGSASCDNEDRIAAAASETDDNNRISSLMVEIEKVFNIQEELAQRPLPKLRFLRNSEWYRMNIVDFLVKTGRCYRVEDLQLQYQGDAGLPSASLSAFSRIIMRAQDWQQVCAKHGPSIQVDGSKLGERVRAQSMRTSLDHLRTRWNLNCLGVLLPPLHPNSAKAQPVPPVFDSQLASCYDVFQHLQGLSDHATRHHLCLLTLDSMSDIQGLMSPSEEHSTKRAAQMQLATRVVSLLYGRDAPAKAELTTELLFNRSRPLHKALPEELVALRSCLRSHRMKYADGVSLLDVLMNVKCFVHPVDHSTEDSAASSRMKQLNMQIIRHEGFSVNAIPVTQDRQITPDDILPPGFTVLGRGRKTYCVIAWE